jgi:hypothetical protein
MERRRGNSAEHPCDFDRPICLCLFTLCAERLMVIGKIIIACILGLLLACSVILVCATSAGLIGWVRQFRRGKTKAKIFRPSRSARISVAESLVLRGYDSDELFREDGRLRETAEGPQTSASLAAFMPRSTSVGTQGFCAERVSAILAGQLSVRSHN